MHGRIFSSVKKSFNPSLFNNHTQRKMSTVQVKIDAIELYFFGSILGACFGGAAALVFVTPYELFSLACGRDKNNSASKTVRNIVGGVGHGVYLGGYPVTYPASKLYQYMSKSNKIEGQLAALDENQTESISPKLK